MRVRLAFAVSLTLVLAVTTLAQRRDESRSGEPQRTEPQRAEPRSGETHRPQEAQRHPPRANQGRIPEPPPQRAPRAKPEAERWQGGRINNAPHVNNNQWYGHDRPNDKRYHLDRPFEHGRFEHFGPSYRYSIERVDANLHRFWLPGGYFFEVPAWDWPLAAGWCWTCANDFVVYEDPDHPGWHLLYNVMTGRFIHVMYLGM